MALPGDAASAFACAGRTLSSCLLLRRARTDAGRYHVRQDQAPDAIGIEVFFLREQGGLVTNNIVRNLSLVSAVATSCLFAADPTFLRRTVANIQSQPDGLTSNAK